MSEQSEQTHGESGVGAGQASSEISAAGTPPAASAEVESAGISPNQEDTVPKPDVLKVEAVKVAVDPKASRIPGKLMVMSPGERSWDGKDAGAKVEPEPVSTTAPKRRFAAMAAVVALATVAGALGGALATAALSRSSGDGVAASASGNSALETTVARIDADIVALKAGLEHTSKIGVSQFNKTSDRLDKIEKAQAEPAAKLAKLSEAVEKLHALPAVAPAVVATAPVAPKEVTGSVTPQAVASAAPAAAPVPAPVAATAAAQKPETGRLPTVDGWVLRDIGHGGALIEGRAGLYEVYAGDPVPGLGRVDAIRKQDGRWVVVTTRGLIVAR